MLEKKSGKSNYFKDVGKELKKVTYPTPALVRKNTIIVIVLSIIVGIFIAVLDWGFGAGAGWLINKDNANQQQDYGDIDWSYDDEGNINGYYQNGVFTPINLDDFEDDDHVHGDDCDH